MLDLILNLIQVAAIIFGYWAFYKHGIYRGRIEAIEAVLPVALRDGAAMGLCDYFEEQDHERKEIRKVWAFKRRELLVKGEVKFAIPEPQFPWPWRWKIFQRGGVENVELQEPSAADSGTAETSGRGKEG